MLGGQVSCTSRLVQVSCTSFLTVCHHHKSDAVLSCYYGTECKELLCMFSSDSLICNLEPVEPVEFDASRLHGVTAAHLTSLMNLTFVGDEKRASNPLFPRPPSPARLVGSDVDGRPKLEPECLEKQLDEEMARSLVDDCVAADDHNADKKFGTQTDGCDGTAMTQTGSAHQAGSAHLTGSVHQAGIACTAVKSLSNTALSQSCAVRDDQLRESTVDNTANHSAPGLCFVTILLSFY